MRGIHTTHTRDAALNQLRRLNRGLIAGSVLLTGVFAEVAANAFPGKTLKTGAAAARSRSVTGKTGSAARTPTRPTPLTPPAEAPKASGEASTEASTHSSEAHTQEPAPSQESAPAQESAPSQESAPKAEAATPQPEAASPPAESQARPESSAPSSATESAPESSGPVVSGGS